MESNSGESTERMSAEQFYKPWISAHPKLLGKSVIWPGDVCIFEFAEAYAEHCITAKQAQIDKLTKDIESGFMVGAYARLQFLQAAERENAELKTAADSALSSLQSKEREIEKLKQERNTLAGELTMISGGDGFLCGLLHGNEKPFLGGCGEHVSFGESYRCTDCTAAFHRDCINQHFELDAYVKNLREIRANGAVDGWKKAVTEAEERAESSAALVRKLAQALKTAKVRLEIYLGRFQGCPLIEHGIDAHPVSRTEIPAWIEELESLLSDPAVENILKT